MAFPWPPLRLLLLATIVGLVSSHWLDVRDAVIVGALTLYLLLAITKA